jgi:hypothetical protein
MNIKIFELPINLLIFEKINIKRRIPFKFNFELYKLIA